MYDDLMDAYTLDNYPLLAISFLTFVFGYLEYVWSFRLMARERRAPYPVWMHTFYLTHDSTWAVIMLVVASRNDWHWFFTSVSVALWVWNCFELYNIYKAVTVERQEVWGDYVRGQVTVGHALGSVVMQLAAFYCLVIVLIQFMGEGSIMQWFLFTNMLIAAAPGVLWAKRGAKENTRRGASVGLAVIILLATVNTFHPWSMWVLAMPDVFDHGWYYATGAVFTVIAAYNLKVLVALPAKEHVPGERRPIW